MGRQAERSHRSFLEAGGEYQPEASGRPQRLPSRAGWVVPPLMCFKAPQLEKTERESCKEMLWTGNEAGGSVS